ncbi:hypothetical protein ABZP36_009539 [Zizania latifolia]
MAPSDGSDSGKVAIEPSSKPAATFSVKMGLAQMLRGGVIMDVVTPPKRHASPRRPAPTPSCMALERVPADIRTRGGVTRLSEQRPSSATSSAPSQSRHGQSPHWPGEAVTGNVVEVVRHMRSVMGDIRGLRNMDDDEVFSYAKRIATPYDLVMQTKHCFSLNHWLHIYTDTLLIVKGEV